MTDKAQDTNIVPYRPQALASRGFSLMPSSLGEAREIAIIIANSGLAPKDYVGKPDMILVAIQMGADLGLKPMQALQNIAVINGRPSIWGDAAAALVQSSGMIERFHETTEGVFPEDSYKAVCIIKRKGWPDEIRREFSVADAKKAHLWEKRGHTGGETPWVTYPKRMLQMRARGFALRDAASDMLMGLVLAEEAQDIPIEGSVVSSEIVEPPKAVSLLDSLPEAVRDNIEKAFETLSMAPGARLAKLNEFLGGDGVDPEEGAKALLEWCRDEFAKRKTGQARAKKGNSNEKAQRGSDAAPAGKQPAPATGEVAVRPDAAGSVASAPAVSGKSDRSDAGADPQPPVVAEPHATAPGAATTPSADLF